MTDRNPGPAAPHHRPTLRERFPALRHLERVSREDRPPFVSQTTASDCGAACLTSVLRFHGKNVLLEQVREVTGTGRDGTNALALLDAARYFGLRGRGVTLDLEELEYLATGTILHWGFRHFVVYEGRTRDGIKIIDPDSGRRLVQQQEFTREFTGVALLFEKSESFTADKTSRPRTWTYILRLLPKARLVPRILAISGLVQLIGLALPVLTGVLVDRVIPRGDTDLLQVLAIGFFFVVVFNFFSSLVRSHLLLYLRTQLDAQMTLDFLDHLVSLPYAFFQKRSAGDLMMRMNSNTIVREILTTGALAGVLDGVMALTYLALILVVDARLGLLVLGLGFLRVVVYLATRRRVGELMSESLSKQANSQGYQVQMLSGIETLKASGTEARAVEQWSDHFVEVLNVSLDQGRLNALIKAMIGSLGYASPLIVMGVGAMQVLAGSLSLGTMLALNALAAGFLVPLSTLAGTALRLQEAGSYIDRIDDVLKTAPEQDLTAVVPADSLAGGITIENVSFSYGPLSPPVLQDISLDILPGQMVAIVGKSAAGKSTLANIVVGLYRPESGRVLYDGTDLTTLETRSVRKQLGIVMQHQYLFGTSIRQNIALADPEARLEDIMQAASLAHIHEEIMAMPMGYDTVLVDGGMSLSGGQRQRIALSRALVGNPAILVLDEATSALDTATERLIQDSLESLACTQIVVAHRLSTIRAADLIVVLDAGRIVAEGTHKHLAAEAGIYRELISNQVFTA